MIALESTARCGIGLRVATLLEAMCLPYALKVMPDGHFLATYGVPGPRLIDGDQVWRGIAAGSEVIERARERFGDSLERFLPPSPWSERAARRLALPTEIASPDDVLHFWFGGPIADEADLLQRARRWFAGGEAMDDEVRARFGGTIEAALRGELDSWAEWPRTRLALVLVLDQLTRNALRGTASAWAGDARAQALCIDALDRGLDATLGPFERVFLAMPLHHAEDVALQARSRAYAERLSTELPARLADGHLEQTAKYNAIIARFGRFPFRNAALGRATTAAETEFLAGFEGPPRVMRAGGPA